MLGDLAASSLLPLQPVWANFNLGGGWGGWVEMGSKRGGVVVCLSESIFSVPNISTLLFLCGLGLALDIDLSIGAPQCGMLRHRL